LDKKRVILELVVHQFIQLSPEQFREVVAEEAWGYFFNYRTLLTQVLDFLYSQTNTKADEHSHKQDSVDWDSNRSRKIKGSLAAK